MIAANVPGFPRKHRHGADSRPNFRLDIQKIGVDLAAVEDIIEKLPFIGREIEQECKPVAEDCRGVLDPRVDILAGGKGTTRQADGEVLTKLAWVARDGVG